MSDVNQGNGERASSEGARTSYNVLLMGAPAAAPEAASDAIVGLPSGTAPATESDAGRSIGRLQILLRRFSTADFQEALDLVTRLAPLPLEHAAWLERLGGAVAGVPGFEPFAFTCHATAAQIFERIGEVEGAQRNADVMIDFDRDDAWMTY